MSAGDWILKGFFTLLFVSMLATGVDFLLYKQWDCGIITILCSLLLLFMIWMPRENKGERGSFTPRGLFSMMAMVISLVVIFPFAASIVETWNLSEGMLQVVGWIGFILLAFGSYYVADIIFNLMEIESTSIWCRLFGHKDEDLGEHTRECSDDPEEEFVFHLFRCKRCGVENEGWIWTWRKKGNKEHNLEKQYEKHWYNF